MTVPKGTALYVRHNNDPAAELAKRFKRIGLSWAAIGAVWQDSPIAQRYLNSPARCRELAKAMRDVGIVPYFWGYPWLGNEKLFVQAMVECAGDDALHLLDPELGMNPKRDPHNMDGPNDSARIIVSGLRAHGAKSVGLSTFGGVPSWFPLRAFLKAGVDFVGGQTYTDDGTIDDSIATFAREIALTGSHAVEVPNYGLYAKDGAGGFRSKTTGELITHLAEFINEGEPVHAIIGWAENFLTTAHERALYDFSQRLAAHHG